MSEKRRDGVSRVIVALPDQQNEYQLLQAEDARAAGARLGLAVEVLDAGGHSVQQVHDLLKALHADPRPAAVVVEPVSNEVMESVGRKVGRLGVGWFMLNATLSRMDDLRKEFPGVAMTHVGSDQTEIGRLQGRQLKRLLPQGGHVLYIQGPPSSVAAQERFRGTSEVVGTQIRLSALDGQWSESSAEAAVGRWLRLKMWEKAPIHAVAAQDDSMARGARAAIAALTGAAFSHVHFLGIDGVPGFGQRLVSEGRLTATVIMPSNTGPALELVDQWLRTGQVPPSRLIVPIQSFPPESELVLRAVSAATRQDARVAP
jgi:ribose transport system substrate-binding protein